MYKTILTFIVQNAQEQIESLKQAIPKPYVLDDYTVNRVLEVFTEQKDMIWLHDRQFNIWLNSDITSEEVKEVNRLKEQLIILEKLIDNILDIANELKENTIEKVLKRY